MFPTIWHFDKCRLRRACIAILSLESLNAVQPLAEHSLNIQATCTGSDQTARMRRLILGFAGRTNHIVGNLMSRLKFWFAMKVQSRALVKKPSNAVKLITNHTNGYFFLTEDLCYNLNKYGIKIRF